MAVKIKTSDATGQVLDYLVAKCEGFTEYDPLNEKMLIRRKEHGWVELCDYNYSTNWSQGGPIIDREKIDLVWDSDICEAEMEYMPADDDSKYRYGFGSGPTPLIAAMRCYVASKLGDEVEIP